MTEKWSSTLFNCKEELWACLVPGFFGCIGVAVVQSQALSKVGTTKFGPCLCALCCCCFGMARNRKRLRQEYKISSSYFVDLLFYCLPLYCCAAGQEYREVILRKSRREERKNPIELPAFMVQAPEETFQRPKSYDPNESCNLSSEYMEEGSRYSVTLFKSNLLDFGDGNIIIKDEEDPTGSALGYSKASQEVTPSLSREPSIIIEPVKEIGVDPIDGNDPEVYSFKRGTGPFTYVPGRPFDTTMPPPTYIPLLKLWEPKPVMSSEILFGLTFQPRDGYLKCTDQEAIAKQKGVVSEVIKQIARSVTSGLGAVGVSLPIRIFEPRSTIERMFDKFSFAPVFIQRAAQTSDQFERFLNVIAFGVSGLYMATRQSKPFNPLLGETFQGSFPDGTQIFAEHVSHHPPIDSFFVMGAAYWIYGFTELDGSIKLNSLVGSFKGPTTVKFRDGQSVIFHQPKFRLDGMLWGDRYVSWEGEFKFEDPGNNWVAILHIGDNVRGFNPMRLTVNKDTILGKIYIPQGNRLDRIQTELATLHGSWVKELVVTKSGVERKLWEMDRDMPVRHSPVADPLPSDWRYREDLVWLSRNKIDHAQKWKTTLETRQREDRELRKRYKR
mmetsp:Transcript_13156/g.24632  ORF Transcript_13156/g.24632 Transcript_13156/m.24632 type:complete len:612 (-) Transcript_13156:2918-4753(-)